jgi:hypothetical protein
MRRNTIVRPEPVEGLSFLSDWGEGEGVDKLSPNGSPVPRCLL